MGTEKGFASEDKKVIKLSEIVEEIHKAADMDLPQTWVVENNDDDDAMERTVEGIEKLEQLLKRAKNQIKKINK